MNSSVRAATAACALLMAISCGGDSDKRATSAGSTEPSSGSGSASGSGSSAEEPIAGGGLAFKGAFDVTGAVAHKGEFTDTTSGLGLTSCTDVGAKGNGGGGHGPEGSFQVPGPPLTEPAGDQVRVTVEVRGYKGPGDYTSAEGLTGNIQVDKGAFYSVADGDATSKLTVKDDGSGVLIFTDAKDSAAGGKLSGSITWSCATG